jgi:Protein of unknown function (DUF2806)
MDENTSLINIGELSRPATILIEKISEAVGGIFKPYQIARVAKAEAQADLVRADSEIKISELHRRAFQRFLNEEALKQKNIEDITEKALPLLKEDSEPKQIEDDWLVHFFDRCRLISDDEMQEVWSRVLAGEANSPGTFSRRTLSFLTGLDKREAEMFTSLCGFAWNIGFVVPFIYSNSDYGLPDLYETNGVGERALKDLESIGLIQLTAGAFAEAVQNPVTYYDKRAELKWEFGDTCVLTTGRVLLTNVGSELALICNAKPVEGFFDLMLDYWWHEYSIKGSELK